MSSRARRLVDAVHVTPFVWTDDDLPSDLVAAMAPRETAAVRPPPPPEAAVDVAAIEREAFSKGYGQGERAGAEAAAARGEAMVRRLAQTIEQLGALRGEMMHRSERQLVQLAIAIATRVIHREISLDRELLIAMARVALDRLGDVSGATIRLHPDDFAGTTASHGGALSSGQVRVVADPAVHRGGCLVQSDCGLIDLSIAAQVGEIANALLGDDATAATEEEDIRVAC